MSSRLGRNQVAVLKLFREKSDAEEWWSEKQVADRSGLVRNQVRSILSRLHSQRYLVWTYGEGRKRWNLRSEDYTNHSVVLDE